jgi:hypothetical protein
VRCEQVDLDALARDIALCSDDTCPCTVSAGGGVWWRACGLHDPEVLGMGWAELRPTLRAWTAVKDQG